MADNFNSLLYAPNIPNYDIGTPLVQGLQTGVQLAQAQQQLENQQQQLQIQKEQHRQQTIDRAITNLATLSKVKGPARKALFQATQQNFAAAGIQIDPNALDYASADPNIAQMVAQVAANRDLLKDPTFGQSFFSMLGNLEKTSPEYSFLTDYLNNQSREYAAASGVTGRLVQTQMAQEGLAQRQVQQQNFQTEQAKRQNLYSALKAAAIDPFDYEGANGPEAQAAAKQALANYQAASLGAQKAKETGTKAAVINARANVIRAENSGKMDEYRSAYMAASLADRQARTKLMGDAIKARLGQTDRRLTLQDEKFTETLVNRVSSNTALQKIEQQVNNADKGLTTLTRPGLTWMDINEASTDFAALLSGSAQIPISREARATFSSLKSTIDGWASKAANHEVGGPSPEEVKIFIDRFNRVKHDVIKYHDQTLLKIVQPRSSTLNAKYRPALEAAFDTAKLNPDLQLPGPGTAAQPAQKTSAAALEKPAAGTRPAPQGLLESLKAKGASPDLIKKIYQGEGYALPAGGL